MNIESQSEDADPLGKRALLCAVGLGTNVAVGVGLFTFIGYYIDRKQGDGMLWTLTGLIIGFFYMFYEFWKLIKVLNKGSESIKRKHK